MGMAPPTAGGGPPTAYGQIEWMRGANVLPKGRRLVDEVETAHGFRCRREPS